jgi:hypothetical protein
VQATNAQLVATNAQLAATLEREQQGRRPWQAVSEPVEPTPRRRWWSWSR